MPAAGKLCRICWNTEHWRRPSLSAAAFETNSYVHTHGFGHEEWLFNFEWMIDGHRFAFLQPINKFRDTYEGTTFPILLYTLTPERTFLAVGVLHNVYIPTKSELQAVFAQFEQNAWIEQMRADLTRINVPTTMLESPEPWELANIRFTPKDVHRLDPMPAFTPGKGGAPLITNRYMPFNWDGALGFVAGGSSADDLGVLSEGDPRRSEALRQRAAQQGTEIDPKHVRMQNRLFVALKKRHAVVTYEENFIDLCGRDPGCVTYYELKTDPTARMCIRNALGQLLDYSYYKESAQAECLVVVGETPATSADRRYLEVLRTQFGLPIKYGWFSWETGDLVQIV